MSPLAEEFARPNHSYGTGGRAGRRGGSVDVKVKTARAVKAHLQRTLI